MRALSKAEKTRINRGRDKWNRRGGAAKSWLHGAREPKKKSATSEWPGSR